MAENQSPETEEAKNTQSPDSAEVVAQAVPENSPPKGGQYSADALSDGTVPTVLTTGDGFGTSVKPLLDPSKQRVTSIYRRADIATSVITMIATLALIGIIFGGYLFLNKSKKVPAPKITTLDQSEITKLGGFLGNDLGSGNGQILTVSSTSLFKGRLAIDNDLKITGNADIGGSLKTGDLTVTKTTNLATTDIKGTLSVSGPTTLQGPAILAGGATVGSNLAVAGNGTFGGAVSAGAFNAKSLTVSGDINLGGHLIIAGIVPTVTAEVGAGNAGRATVDGTDSAGTIIVTTGTVGTNSNTTQINGILTFVSLKFHSSYTKTPHVLLTAVGYETGQIGYFVLQTATGFTIQLNSPAKSASSYAYNYWVVQ